MNFGMKKSIGFLLLATLLFASFQSCKNMTHKVKVRSHLVDTVGFAQYSWQMDSLMNRIKKYQGDLLQKRTQNLSNKTTKAVLSPHDDYTYVGFLYPAALQQIKAKTVIIFGVAHKAKKLHLENQIIFDSYDYWKGPYGNVKVSDLRDKIIRNLPKGLYQVNDSMQAIEHSVEAEIPWLQYFNPKVQIISILVPYMPFERMQEIAGPLAKAIRKATESEGMQWGKDYAFVLSTDAVHYGDQGWGGENFAFYGTACTSYTNAKGYEMEILHTLSGYISEGMIHKFCDMTVEKNDFHKYKWTWCGRYSVPMGLLTINKLNEALYHEPLHGQVIGYSTSIEHEPIPVKDLRMGVTAPANDHHWVGYAAIKYY
jgi:AmmeMemoRadiSam system protein B